MSVLYWHNDHDVEQPAQQVAEFMSTANNDLARALQFLKNESLKNRAKLLAEYPHLKDAIAPDNFDVPFTVVINKQGGYTIYMGDGPDRYYLLDQ